MWSIVQSCPTLATRRLALALSDSEYQHSSIGGAGHDSDFDTCCLAVDVAATSSLGPTRTRSLGRAVGARRLSDLVQSPSPAAVQSRTDIAPLVLVGAGAGGVPGGRGRRLDVRDGVLGHGAQRVGQSVCGRSRRGRGERGSAAARRYAEIAPSAPHAQHMPSHIFVRLGLWDETITANQRAFEAGLADARAHNQPVAPERLHALDYMVYAYLQEGRDRAARITIDTALGLLTTATSSDVLIANYNRVAMEARLPLERSDWAAAARLPVRAAELTIGAALDHFARGIGATRQGDTAQP